MYTLSQKGIAFIKRFEGFRSKAYQDSVGVWTIGYGHTSQVAKNAVCTEAQAQQWLLKDAAPTLAYLRKLRDDLKPNEVDALVSFAYNVGLSNFSRSTLATLVKHHAPAEMVAKQFPRWNKAGGKVLDGLTRRRNAEAQLYVKGIY